MSFQANQNAAFVDERGKFKLQWLSCRLTFPRPILLAGSLRLLASADKILARDTLSKPARRLSFRMAPWSAKHLTMLISVYIILSGLHVN